MFNVKRCVYSRYYVLPDTSLWQVLRLKTLFLLYRTLKPFSTSITDHRIRLKILARLMFD